MLLLLSGIGLALFALAVFALLWQARSGQLDDLDTPALRALLDDEQARAPASGAAPASAFAPADGQAPATPTGIPTATRSDRAIQDRL